MFRSHQSFAAPLRIQLSNSAMSGSGSGRSGGMRRLPTARINLGTDDRSTRSSSVIAVPTAALEITNVPSTRLRYPSARVDRLTPARTAIAEWQLAVAQLGSRMAVDTYDQVAGRGSVLPPQPE